MIKFQAEVKDYLVARGWDKLSPVDLAKSIMIEGAELLELFQWNNYSVDQIDENEDLKGKIQKEMADVMIYCTELAVRLDLDVEKAILEKLEHSAKKYPADEIQKHKGEKTEKSFYLQRKMEYRKAQK